MNKNSHFMSLLVFMVIISFSHSPLLAQDFFNKGGQNACFHRGGQEYGLFHTYDQFAVSNFPNHKIHVFLPPEYEESGERYPVIYMNDGQTAFWPGGASPDSWEVAQTVGELVKMNIIRKVIVVAINANNREFEYTADNWALGQRPWGGLKDYTHYIAYDVKAFIDDNYRTLSDREHTAIVGSSHGGLAAFYIGAFYQERFGIWGLFSPSIWAASSTTVKEAMKKVNEAKNNLNIWITYGKKRDGGLHNSVIERLATRSAKNLSKKLQKKDNIILNKNLFVVSDNTGGHTEKSWAKLFRSFLIQFFSPKINNQ